MACFLWVIKILTQPSFKSSCIWFSRQSVADWILQGSLKLADWKKSTQLYLWCLCVSPRLFPVTTALRIMCEGSGSPKLRLPTNVTNKCYGLFVQHGFVLGAKNFSHLPLFPWRPYEWKGMGRALPQLVEALRQNIGGSGFESWQGAWKFSSDIFLLSAFSSPGSTQPLTEMSIKDLFFLI